MASALLLSPSKVYPAPPESQVFLVSIGSPTPLLTITSCSQDPLLKYLADTTSLTVVSVGYRLAPEHPFPDGPQDCLDIAEYLVDHAESEYGGPLKMAGGEVYLRSLFLCTTSFSFLFSISIPPSHLLLDLDPITISIFGKEMLCDPSTCHKSPNLRTAVSRRAPRNTDRLPSALHATDPRLLCPSPQLRRLRPHAPPPSPELPA